MIKKLTIIGFLIFATYMAWLIPQVIVAIEMTSQAMENNLGEPSSESIRYTGAHSGLADDREKIKAYIRSMAEVYDIDPALPLKIAECESQFKNVCNPQYGCSGGIGIYQLTQETFDEAVEKRFREGKEAECPESLMDECLEYWDVFDVQHNINIALWLMSKGEYWRWKQSEHCWRK